MGLDGTSAHRVLTALLAMQRQSWEQGVAGHALLDLGCADTALLLADAAVTRQHPDGRLGDVGGEDGAVNGAACGELVRHAARLDGDPRWTVALDRQLDWLVSRAPRAADGTLFHLLSHRQVWADTVYMVVPLLAACGRADLAVEQLTGHRRRLWDPGTGLYAARWDEGLGRLEQPQKWATGNGWVVAGIARALRLAPDRPAGWGELAGHAREVIDACLAYRGEDGLFGDVLDDPRSFREANVAQMLAYATLTGAADGWLPPAYARLGRELFGAAARRVDGRGLVTGVSGAPHFTGPGTSAEAQAFHLLAYAAAGGRLDVR
ncbi:glycoside hydrolase family 88 protein [Micromonospora mirobrigensis]|uniref:Unsaturated rhamnogalacturonyl hydrolase n=1 Tax=Micromonospora mirobrigensis TaxID=262898 RepID=A0A1C4Z6P0_9ACTN|nr:glycoside hydrolase family 88 protein [Micromonospora mirobrigensis]SCF28567.1 unsaturated rhamnogalacturonyl hydrolase [Micromonospora mirobrigensis]